MRYCMDVVLNRNSTQTSWWKCAVVAGSALACLTLAGCGTSANGEYKDFSETAKQKVEEAELPFITPGEPDNQPADAVGEIAAGSEVNQVAADVDPNETVAGGSTTGTADQVQPGGDLLEEPGTRDEIVMEAREVKLLIANKDFGRDKKTKALRVTYDDIDLLKILNMEPVPTDAVDHFPDWLKQLNGKEIRIRGFMYPTYSSTGLTGFLLARDNGICCFVRKAKIYDLFVVKLAEGQTTDYIQGVPFDVVGTFHIDPLVEDDELLHLYRIDEARVIAK